MKRLFFMILFLFLYSTANATLWDRGGGLIYDDIQNITWLQDASLDQEPVNAYNRFNWVEAMEWADQLVFGGFDDWRLPTAYQLDGSGPFTGYAAYGEMGFLAYNYLNKHNLDRNPSFVDGNGNLTYFTGFIPSFYYTSTIDSAYPQVVYSFIWQTSDQDRVAMINSGAYAWAVRDGDILPPVPEPNTILLFGLGLLGLAGVNRKKQ